MSITTKRTIHYSVYLFAGLLVFASLPLLLIAQEPHIATANADPLPWWQQVETFQSLAVKWIGALTVIIGGLATLVAFIIAKIQEIQGRLNRGDERQHQEKVADAVKTAAKDALSVPPRVEIVNDPRHPVPVSQLQKP